MMINRICLFSLISILLACATKINPTIEITYIAQSGVFIQSDSRKILIDAVYEGDSRWDYPSPSEGLLDSLQEAKPPFNNIDLFLVTHAHLDHFSPKSLEKSLVKNPKAVLVTTPVVKQLMEKDCEDYLRIKKQVFAPLFSYNFSIDTTINNIFIHISHSKHSNDKEWPAAVYSFLIEINGKKILHNGGSKAYFIDEYKKIRYDSLGVDIAILYHDFFSDSLSNDKVVIDKYVNPKNILLGHADGHDYEFMDSLKNELIDEYPNLSVFRKPLETWRY